jgi:hypothetical protein
MEAAGLNATHKRTRGQHRQRSTLRQGSKGVAPFFYKHVSASIASDIRQWRISNTELRRPEDMRFGPRKLNALCLIVTKLGRSINHD